MPKKRSNYNRINFEASVSANKRTVAELEELKRKGLVQEDMYVFTLDDLLEICAATAIGFYNLAAIQTNPPGKWSMQEFRPTMVREIIKEAFSSKTTRSVRKAKTRSKNKQKS